MKLPPQIVDMLAPGPNEARVLVLEHEHPIALQLQGWIDKHERARCRRFQDERDRLGAAVTWGLLRFGIGVLTGCDPLEARIRRDSYGRPQIEGVSRDRMDLNVSRRRGCSVLVLARGVRCGVDIERIEPDLLSDELLQTLLSRSEIDRAVGEPSLFFERWSAMEAVLKGDGRGLSDGTAAATLISEDQDLVGQWRCGERIWRTRPILTPSGFVGQVAVTAGCVQCVQIPVGQIERLAPTRSVCAVHERVQP